MSDTKFDFFSYIEALGAVIEFQTREGKKGLNVRRYIYGQLQFEFSWMLQDRQDILLAIIDANAFPKHKGEDDIEEEGVLYMGKPPQNKNFADQLLLHIHLNGPSDFNLPDFRLT